MSIAERPKTALGLLVNGERMSQPEFHRRYEAYHRRHARIRRGD